MPDFFKSLFQRNTKEPESSKSLEELSISYDQLEAMSFPEGLALLQSMLSKTPVRVRNLSPFIQRFYRIALYDNHVPQEHRETALQLAETLTADYEAALLDNPQAVSALKHANRHMIEKARLTGYGSLAWMLREYAIPDADLIPYVMKPEHRHLVPDFFTAMPQPVAAKIKGPSVRELVLQSSYDSRNAILILHGLCAKGDKAACALFTPDEYCALLGVPDNYDAGRGVLVGLGLLPAASGARPFKRVQVLKEIVALILQERKDRSEADSRVADLPEDLKIALLITLAFLRIELARGQLSQIYGEEVSNDVLTIFKSPEMKAELPRFKEMTQVLRKATPGTPIDLALLDTVLSRGGLDLAKSEEDFEHNREFLDMAAEWINAERVAFLDYFRLMMRLVSDPGLPTRSPADKQILAYMSEMYARVGAQAGIAEQTMCYEDWIGTGRS